MRSLGVRISPLEEMRFGVVTARVEGVGPEEVPSVLEFCSAKGVQLLIARCDADNTAATLALERAGGLLTESALDYRHDLKDVVSTPLPAGITARLALADDEDALRRVATASFGSLPGHYHADPRLDPDDCREVYVDWIGRTISTQGPEGFVVVTETCDGICGFLAGRMESTTEGLLFIGAVSPEARGKGAFRALAGEAVREVSERGGESLTGATQVTNFAVQSGFRDVGFYPFRAYHTFHKWFD